MPRDEACGLCRFFNRGLEEHSHAGGCRKNPPQLAWISQERVLRTSFPIVEDDCWCGEFAPILRPTLKDLAGLDNQGKR